MPGARRFRPRLIPHAGSLPAARTPPHIRLVRLFEDRQAPVLLALILLGPVCLAAPHVAFVANVPVHSYSPNAYIQVVDLATGETVNVSEGLFSARSPAWAPDGSCLVFEAETGGQQDIFLCRPDGSERINVTDTSDRWECSPVALAADRVAYLSGPDRTEVVVCDLPPAGRGASEPSASTAA